MPQEIAGVFRVTHAALHENRLLPAWLRLRAWVQLQWRYVYPLMLQAKLVDAAGAALRAPARQGSELDVQLGWKPAAALATRLQHSHCPNATQEDCKSVRMLLLRQDDSA
mmetsp:Transcript_127091/g.220245  ORF Transcript_127091/g.220245 Transcript_127091/m.220245 type:complete len:110 (-) Transcript_127091:7-336(-)